MKLFRPARAKGELRIAINKRIRHFPSEPHFWDVLQVGMRRAGYKLVYDLDHPAHAVLIMHGALSKLEKIKRLQEKGAKLIQRVDGLHGNNELPVQEHPKDRGVCLVHQLADAVIYQSEFCRAVAEAHLPKTRPECRKYVIWNGADEQVFTNQGPTHNKFGFAHMLVSAARWRAWKGLDRTIETFLKLGREDTVLAVIGDRIPEQVRHPRIRYLGRLTHKEMARVYRGADVFVYLPWFDWCPNAVVEALVSGVPVVCSSKGGTKELVGPSGIVVPTEPYDDVVNFNSAPALDIEKAAEAVSEVLEHRERYVHPRPELTLTHVVEEYLRVIREVSAA